ncbi:MAG: hypothetical protein OXH52_06250, partial [Gammaproteobacteria bacterium]|nr:hypothetical protein [Gammaproteobacteria bacterium]
MPTPDKERAASLLARHWNEVVEGREEFDTTCQLEKGIREKVRQLLHSEMVAFAYSLPTQILGKLTDPNLDAGARQICWILGGAVAAAGP